jgi:His-Xaa-Ser system radical SAM maturase HxsB
MMTDYVLPIKAKKIGNRYLIANNTGAWAVLKESEYDSLYEHKMGKELFSDMEDKDIVYTNNNKSRIINRLREKYKHLFQATSLHIIVVTLRCNLKCRYCHASSKPITSMEYDMDKKTAEKTVDFILQSPSKSLTIEFQGGEPLANFPIIQHIVEYAKKANTSKKEIRFVMVTNLTLMTDKILDYLTRNKIFFDVSFDGPKNVHDANRIYANGNGSYDVVTKWLRKLRKKKIKTSPVLTATKLTLKYPKEIVNEYLKQGFSVMFIRPPNKIGFAAEAWKDLKIDAQEFFNFWKSAIEYIIDNKLPIKELMTSHMLKKIQGEESLYTDLQSPCGAAIGQMAYHYNGDIYSCDEGRMVSEDIFKLGNVFEDDYKKIISSPITRTLIKTSVNDGLLCDACIFKPYCGICMACSYATQGNIIPKLPMDFRCQVLMSQFTFLFEKLIFDEKYKPILKDWMKVQHL